MGYVIGDTRLSTGQRALYWRTLRNIRESMRWYDEHPTELGPIAKEMERKIYKRRLKEYVNYEN